MAVVFDALGPGSSGSATGNVTNISWSHTCGSGSNRLLVVGVGMGGGTSGISLTTTYGATAMTSAGLVLSNNQFDGFVQLFYLIAPAAGTNTINVSVDSSQTRDLLGGSLSFTGVNQTTPIANIATNFGFDTNPTVAVTSAAGNIVVDAAVCGSALISSNQTLQWMNNLNGNSGASNAAQSTAAGASSVTMSYSSNSDWWGIIATSIQASAPPAVYASAWLKA